MDQFAIPWQRMGLLRAGLGVCGVAAGLALGLIFVTVWHWAALFVLFMFGVRAYGWVYAWDLLFVGLLLWEGYRYKARMPPPNPFTKAETIVAQVALGTSMFTPQQAAFSVSEILYVAPRFFFWGVRHLQRIAWPSSEAARGAEQIRDALQSSGTWVPFEQLQGISRTRETAAQAVAMLVRAELAEGRFRDEVLSFRACEPEWV